MRYGSVCSGIEAATQAWHSLGWEPAFFSEIEPFPRSVLKRHYPEVPLHGDFTTIKGDEYGAINLLVGGTPCQSFSVAGLRKGLDDPRGNLMLEFGALARRTRAKWVVWENVPGVLSSNGGRDFASFLDMLEALGYICDCDILDAQFHGVAQRRRRVFVCGQHRDYLIAQRTDSSALTIAQCLQEILHAILIVQQQVLEREPQSLDLAYLSRDGISRRMTLFGMLGEVSSWPMLQSNLIEAYRRFRQGQSVSAATLGEKGKERTQEGQLKAFQMESQSTLTEPLLKKTLDEAYEVMKSYITSTETSSITQSQIYTCSQAALNIARLIALLNQSSPCYWSAASSALISIREYTKYARQTTSDIFGDMERVQSWLDFIKQAEPASEFIGSVGIESFGEVFSIADSLQGHLAPSREAGERIADTITVGANQCSGRPGDFVEHIASTGEVSHCLNAGGMGRQDYETETLIAHTLRGEGFDASEDGTGRGTPLVPVAIPGNCIDRQPDNGGNGLGADDSGVMYTLTKTDIHAVVAYGISSQHDVCLPNEAIGTLLKGSPSGGGNPLPAVAFAQNQRDEVRVMDVAGALAAEPGAKQQTYLAQAVGCFKGGQGSKAGGIGYDEHVAPTLSAADSGSNRAPTLMQEMQVRRLTPVECERLQGFPDGYTDIKPKGKPTPDGPRYKALGNSMAVPVMHWIGKRIQEVEEIRAASSSHKSIKEAA